MDSKPEEKAVEQNPTQKGPQQIHLDLDVNLMYALIGQKEVQIQALSKKLQDTHNALKQALAENEKFRKDKPKPELVPALPVDDEPNKT
jgi:predicted transcriptional regulator